MSDYGHDRWATRLGRWWDDHWIRVVASAVPTASAGLFAAANYVPIEYQIFTLAGGFIALLGQFVLIPLWIRRDERISELQARARRAEIAAEGMQQSVDQICRWYLLDISDNLDFAESDRVTLYIHNQNRNAFERLAREARNPAYKKSGRIEYPDKEGCIAKAWQKGRHFEQSPAFEEGQAPGAHEKVWIEWCKSQGISKGIAGKITMRSLLYFGWRIRSRDRSQELAIVIIESTNRKRWTEDQLVEVFSGRQDRMLDDLIEIVARRIPDRNAAKEREM